MGENINITSDIVINHCYYAISSRTDIHLYQNINHCKWILFLALRFRWVSTDDCNVARDHFVYTKMQAQI